MAEPDTKTMFAASEHPPLDDATRRRGRFLLCAAVAMVGVTMAMQIGLGANYLADVIGLNGDQVGYLEAIRESCGIIALGLLVLLAGLAEPLVGAGMLGLLAVGISGYYVVGDYNGVIIASLVWSQGLHVWMPLPNSMAIAMAEPGREGYRLGQTRSADSFGFIAGIVLALFLGHLGMQIRPMYLIAGAAAVLAALFCLALPRDIKTPGPRFVFRRKYGLFYALCFLEGWRKQVFVAFAGYLLVKVYDTPLTTILTLHVIVRAIGFVSAPTVGRLIDRIGERRVLLFYYASLIVFFVGYALIDRPRILYVIFVVEDTFFVFAMSLHTMVGRIAPKNELTPTFSMGVASNHVAAVMMPLVGGILWVKFGYEWTFFVGAFAAAVSVAVVAIWVPKYAPPSVEAGAGG